MGNADTMTGSDATNRVPSNVISGMTAFSSAMVEIYMKSQMPNVFIVNFIFPLLWRILDRACMVPMIFVFSVLSHFGLLGRITSMIPVIQVGRAYKVSNPSASRNISATEIVRRVFSAVGRARIPMIRIAATTNASRILAMPSVAMLFSIAIPFFFIMTRKLTSPVLAGRSCANRL